MFWHNNYAPSIQIDSLLSEDDITLNKLMDAEDILQECKSQNKKLIEYLTRSDILEELVDLITEEPSQNLEERWRYKYSNIACELLTCDVPLLTEKLAGNEMLLSKLYSFIDKDQPLNPLLASFVTKTFHALLRRASDQNWISHQFVCLQVLEFLKSRKNCIDLLLRHIQTSAIMDFLITLIIKIEDDEMRQNVLNWLDDQQLVQRLVKLLSPFSDSEKHTNVSLLLRDIIQSSFMEPEKRLDPILQTLQSEETIKLILNTILTGEKLESSIVGGTRILINLLGQRRNKSIENNDYGFFPLNNIVEDEQREKFALIIVPYMDGLNQLLLTPPEKPSVRTTAGFLEKPFGLSRLFILKLYVKLLSTKNLQVLEKFFVLDTFNILLDLFFQFTWNNFLHTQVEQCLLLVMSCDCSKTYEIIYPHMFVKNRLIHRILEAWKTNENNKSNTENGIRQGYMGHLIQMANGIVICEQNDFLSNYIKTNLPEEISQEWESFKATKLDEINKKQELILGDPPESYMMSSSSNSDEYSSFPLELNSHEKKDQSTVPIYVDYNHQENDGYDTFLNSMDQLKNLTFNLSDDDYESKQELFNRICDDKKDDWERNSDFPSDKSDWSTKKIHHHSSSSDEEEDDDVQDSCMKADATDPWNSMNPLFQSPINLWNTEAPVPVEQTGWANFDNFGSLGSIDTNFENPPHSEEQDISTELSTLNEDFSLTNSKTSNNSINKQNKMEDNTNKSEDSTKLEIEETNVSSELNPDCSNSSVYLSESTVSVTITENRICTDIDRSIEESSNISETSPENYINVETVMDTENNDSSSIISISDSKK